MDILNQIIEKLTKEELRNFKLSYKSPAPIESRKDLILFNYIRSSGSKFSEEKAIEKLNYDAKDKNTYYRLKNRLIVDIGDSLSVLHAHKNDLYELLQFIQLFHIYYSRNLFKTCLFYLRKAERLANAVENYELLDIVYANFIRLSGDLIEVEPMVYIKKRETNALIVSNLRELDDILATLSYNLKVSQNFGSIDKNLLKKLQEKVKVISKKTTSKYGKNLEARIYRALSQIYLQQHNYMALESLVKETYKKFEHEKWFDKSNHELKLQMLTYGANALYKNKNYKESLVYSEKLGKEINEFGKIHFEKYLFFYYNSKVLNYAVLDPARGLKALDEFEQEARAKKSTYYDFFIYLNKAALFYDLGRYADSLKSLVRLYLSDGYAKASQSFKLKVEVCELIITFESGDKEVLKYRMEQVKKSFSELKKKNQYRRDFEVLQLLEDMNASPNYRQDKDILKKMKAMLHAKYDEVESDAEIIKYQGWLDGKLNT